MKKYYLDTNIWLDYFENRSDGVRPLGEFAFNFLKNCILHKCNIFYSDFNLFELKNKLSNNDFYKYSNVFKENMIFIKSTKKDWEEAKQISKKINLHKADSLHLILAIKNKCTLITRDKHFDLIDLIEIKKPEDVNFT